MRERTIPPCLAMAVLVVGASVLASAQTATIQPAAATASTATIELPLPADGIVPIVILRSGDPADTTFTVAVSGLQDGTGAAVTGTLNGTSGSEVTGLTAPTGVTKLELQIKPVPATGQVTGLLTIATVTPMTWRLNLTRGGKATATLALDNPAIVRELRCHWLWGCGVEQGEATVHVWEKGHAWPLTNVGVRLEQLTKAGSNFDAPKNLRTTFNGQSIDLWRTPPQIDDQRSVPASAQAQVKFIVRDLSPGEYAATLRLHAANTIADDGQKVALQVSVKHPILWPVLFLLGGLGLSLVGTKWLNTLRKRLEIKSRISDLNAPWLRQEPPTAAVVWAVANLRLIREAATESVLSVPESLTARLDGVASLITVLRSIHDVRTSLAAVPGEHSIPPIVLDRAGGVLGGIVRRCSDPPLDAAVVTAVTEDLKGLQMWVKPTTWNTPYWNDLAPELRSLVHDVRPEDVAEELEDTKPRETLKALRDALLPHAVEDAAIPPEPVQIERKYGALKVLWERRNLTEFTDMVRAYSTGSPDAVFRIADDAAWDRLKKAVADRQVFIEYSAPEAQALEPFTVTVVPRDSRIAASFLFRHKLQYDWVIERVSSPEEGSRKRRRPFVLRPRTLQPMVSQYAPFALTVRASVTIRREGSGQDVLKIEGAHLTVRPSESLGLFSGFTALDSISTLVIGGAAVVSGLSTFYVASPSFGSAKDYVALVLWALAFDQAKNGIIQLSPARHEATTT